MQKLGEVITTEQKKNPILNMKNSLLSDSFECELCEDSGVVFSTFLDTHSQQELECMKDCDCALKKRQGALIEQMPPLYRDADLRSIQPWETKHAKQKTVLEAVLACPHESYLFLGNSGVGKSFIAWALWKNAAFNGIRTPVINTTSELIKEFQDYAVDSNAERPKVLPADLAQNSFKYTILLDEIEKFKVTEFSIERLFELVKNAVDYKHQLLVTSQMRLAELKTTFSKIDPVWGSAIMRRLVENTLVVEMWK